MYPPITLYPNGSFMLCEDVAEFDENVPVDTESPIHVRRIQQVKAELENQHGDPVSHFINKIKPIYEGVILELLNMSYGSEDPNTSVENLEDIATAANTVAMMVRKIVMKREASDMVDCSNYAREPFANHLGFFMKHVNTVRQQGIETYNYSYTVLPAFKYTWETANLVRCFTSNPELFRDILYANNLEAICGVDTSLARNFSDTLDFMKCIFTDPARMSRLEETISQRIEYGWLLSHHGDGCGSIECDPGSRSVYGPFLSYISHLLREINMECYHIQCEITDGHGSSTIYTEHVKTSICQIVNMFFVGVCIGMRHAFEMRKHQAMRTAVEEYTTKLLTILKSQGGEG